MAGWTAEDSPRQDGRLAVVTGAAGGIGLETVLGLSRTGAEMVLTARDTARGQDRTRCLRETVPGGRIRFMFLDVASLESVMAFARQLEGETERLDILVNNAGVMALPHRQVTVDGFEMQFGTNYLGHFALTALLLPLLRRAPAPRVVSIGSNAHHRGRIDFDDLQGMRYRPWKAYAQSKLAMLMFAQELQRRSDAGGWGITSVAAHPGWARTDLIAKGPASAGRNFIGALAPLVAPWFSQDAAAGALPTLYAATAPEAKGGGYYGPDGWHEVRGAPAPARLSAAATDRAAAARLWEVSEALTGVRFPAAPAA
jgi:NAD(P)-dependent dehydrogenase (short-subunit alcohol dehydrogenase family)